ncbi:hypothetical protein Clacol_005482 [Clathrus columnatus]|uniref:ZW10 C-terminal helical domain-containing protein n=1 Tax=Clathrus columnatus TaxID=1419009 RepID=A0AAV5AAA5_9AGAM|nr:hypothetical protein Clacol_005482 [Clathrus columnatus]
MAFELPDHLPRGGFPRDTATQILNKLGQTSLKELNIDLVTSWVGELGNAIQETKVRDNSIANKIQDDLHEFDRLFQSSVDVQSRLREITSAINDLEENLESPTTGIIPKLIETLTLYSTRERSALESEVTYHTLEHLYKIYLEIQKLRSHVDCGELAEAAQVCHDLETFILNAPAPLQNANIMNDIRKRHRTLHNHIQELLSNAYDHCVSFSDETCLKIRQWATGGSFGVYGGMVDFDGQSHPVPPVSTKISLSAIISSLSQDALSSKLANLRRDVLSKMVDSILISSHIINISEDDSSASFAVILSSESTSPVQSLRGLANFLRSHLTPSLSRIQSDFEELLHASMCSSLLTKFLQPSIPSSLSAIPIYLNTLDDAINFENEQPAVHLAGSRYKEKHINNWADEIGMHYEKKRRDAFLEKTRMLIMSPNDGTTFKVEMIVESTATVAISPTLEKDNGVDDQWGFGDEIDTNGTEHVEATLLSTDTEPTQDKMETEDSAVDEDSWGWKDDDDDVVADDGGSGTEGYEESQTGDPTSNDTETVSAPLNEEEEIDPWDDDPWAAPEDESLEPYIETKPIPPPITVPALPAKTAKRLEKFTAKAAKAEGPTHSSGRNTPTPSPAVSDVPSLSAVQPQTSSSRSREVKSPFQPPSKKEVSIKEFYLVTVRARRILEIAGEVLREGKETLQTSVFSKYRPQNDRLGQTLLGTTASIIDLYRALYPISQALNLTKDSTKIMQLSNDCLFLSKEMPNFKFPDNNSVNGKWLEAQERTQTLGKCGFEDAIATIQGTVGNLLAEADGFANVSEEHRYEKCKDVVHRILDELQDTTQRWKKILSKSQYFTATGRIIDDALYRLMDEIISLEDIPQKDSEYLSEFCEMMEKLEESFIYAPGEKGSIADISYMFEQGHLVDYEIDELVRLLRALFAKTPLRESTITKFMQGHPNIEVSY